MVASTPFIVKQAADFDADGKVNVSDITAFVLAYISYWSHQPYDTRADMDNNETIDINDITLFCLTYIQYWSWN
jgi:hypothetical protein